MGMSNDYYEQRWSPILVTPDTWYDKSMFEVFEIHDGTCLNCFAPIGWVNGTWLPFYITDEDGENAVCPTCYDCDIEEDDYPPEYNCDKCETYVPDGAGQYDGDDRLCADCHPNPQ